MSCFSSSRGHPAFIRGPRRATFLQPDCHYHRQFRHRLNAPLQSSSAPVRRTTVVVDVGGVMVGGHHPVVVQSMTNTDTADVESTVRQVAALWRAGSEIVRVTVNNEESARAVPYIVDG